MYGTTAAIHTDGTEIRIATEDYVPRARVFDAICDEIDTLWPDLWTTATLEEWAEVEPIEVPATVGGILNMRVSNNGRWDHYGWWDFLSSYPLSSTGQAVQISGVNPGVEVQLKYMKKPSRPDAEADTLADHGVEDAWLKVIIPGVVASLIANHDLSQATLDFITQSLEVEAGGPPGTGADIRNALLQFRDFQLRMFKRQQDMKRDERVVVDESY
jgi:hypothetical protein